MISRETIQKVHEACNIVEVISDYVQLKKKGVNYGACCPFHDEKTPSFVVSPLKNIYKCFGCGESGNSISFVMKQEGVLFVDAIERLAEKYNIEIVKTEIQVDQKKLDLETELKKVNAYALKTFRENYALLPTDNEVRNYLLERLTIDDIVQWQIGIANGNSKQLTSPLINAGLYEPAKTAGLVNEREGQAYDFFKNRIIYPILDEDGISVLGFSGRSFPGADKKYAKYMNSAETPLYEKNRILYGFHFAKKQIAKTGIAYLVEGNHDVIAMHRLGFINTVGTCGTALTENHVQQLKRIANSITIIRDGDAAGLKAAKRDVAILMRTGFEVNIVFLPEGEDPDSFTTFHTRISLASCDAIFGYSVKQFIHRNIIDCIQWYFEDILKGTENKIGERAKAVSEIIKLLRTIPNATVRNSYIDHLCKKYKIKTSDFAEAKKTNKKKNISEDQVIELTDDEEVFKRLTIQQRTDYVTYGFFEKREGAKTGYYFRDGYNGIFKPRTNFVIEPLYHVYGGDNRRMIKVTNGITEDEVVEMNSKNMLSVDGFTSALFDKGHYIPREGFTKDHLLRVHNKIGNKYPRVFEITSLGWQPEGFFAFQNKVYKPSTHDAPGQLSEYNEYGIAQIGEQLFLSPSLSKTFEGLREGDNPYENDLYLQHKKREIDFCAWANLISSVYGKNGWMGIAWCVGTLFRDLIHKTSPLPHINPYGQKGSGKSEFGNSLNWLFFSGKDSNGEMYKPMNLNQGTDFAFFNRYERFRNCPNILNEFDENAIKDEWFRAIKSSYDGEGREKGKGQKNLTGTQKINSSTCIQGQYLSTKDDNSVLSRSIPLAFSAEENRPEEQVIFFRRLKENESKGLSSILCELLDLRKDFSKNYDQFFYENMKEMQDLLFAEGVPTIDRLLKNVTTMVTCIQITAEKFELPFSLAKFKEYAKGYLKMILSLVAKTSKLAEFWKIIESLISQGVLEEGWEYDVKMGAGEVKLEKEGIVRDESFSEPKDLLFIRMNAVYPVFAKEFKQMSGAKATNDETIALYIREQKYYVGLQKNHKFSSERQNQKMNTSAMVLDLNMIGMSLARSSDEDATSEKVVGMVGQVTKPAEPALTPGTWQFTIKSIITQNEGEKDESIQEIHIRCFTKVPSAASDLQELRKMKFNGVMMKNFRGKQVWRTMTVESYEAETQGTFAFPGGGTGTEGVPLADDLPF